MIQEDVELILKNKKSEEGGNFIAWHPEENGLFTFKSVDALVVSEVLREARGADSSNRPDGVQPIWSKVPQKVRICALRLVVQGLPTMQSKHRRHLAQLGTCLRSSMESEDAFHALIIWPGDARVWEVMQEVWEVPVKEDVITPDKEGYWT
jgi:hypothetical protein